MSKKKKPGKSNKRIAEGFATGKTPVRAVGSGQDTQTENGIPALPEAFLARMEEMLGEDYPAFLRSYGETVQPTLRLNPRKVKGAAPDGTGSRPSDAGFPEAGGVQSSDAGFLETLKALPVVPWEPLGRYYDEALAPGKHPLHAAGAYYIQEASAMAPVRFLDPRPGERVLDLCAAPGGKTTQIGALMEDDGLLVCNEIMPKRAKILSENVERMGLGNVLVCNENPIRLQEFFPEYFDRILVDAPCSGEGMFRKHPEARNEWSPENVEICAQRQAEILDCAARMLRPGGRLVFSTCTFAPAEDEQSVTAFLKAHPEFSPVGDLMPAEGMESLLPGTLRLWPHRLQGEGHFLAVLEKGGIAPQHAPALKTQRPAALDTGQRKAFEEFCEAVLQEFDRSRMVMFGDQLYLMPEGLPSLAGLKVLRAGLHLGTFRKDRFEPSHALALYLTPSCVKRSCALDERQAREYLKGMTILLPAGEQETASGGPASDDDAANADSPASDDDAANTDSPADLSDGWILMTIDGLSLGWGKKVGASVKNHYPKGLRSL